MSGKIEQDLESVVIFFEDCSLFLLWKFGKMGNCFVVSHKGIKDKKLS